MLAVDRSRFPSDTLSTHVNFPSAVAEIQAIGALDRVLVHDPPRCYHGMIEADGVRCLQKFAAVDGIDYGICLPRPELDLALVETTREAGAQIREHTSLEQVLWSGGRVCGVVLREADGSHTQVNCRMLVGADGRRSTTARLVGADRPYRGSRNERGCAFWYMDDPQVGTVWRERLIQLRSGPTHALIFPCPNDRVLCLFMGPAVDIPRFRVDPEGMWEAMLAENPAVRARLGGATNFSKLRSTGDNVAFFRRSSGPGWALAGDAGHFKDPIIGQGIRDAIRFGRLLGEACGPVLDDPVACDAARPRRGGSPRPRVQRDLPLGQPGVARLLRLPAGELGPRRPGRALAAAVAEHVRPRPGAAPRAQPGAGRQYLVKAMLQRGVDRKALLREALTEINIDRGAWREELRPRFRSTRITPSERPDYEWPPRTPGARRRETSMLD